MNVWMQTVSGKQVFLLAPSVDSIDIGDIAHHLSMQVRWVGAVREFYSVAQHSVHVAALVSPEARLWALLHDASEAYLGDVNARLKASNALSGYRAVEAPFQQVIHHRFGLRGECPAEVHEADLLVRRLELHDVVGTVCAAHDETMKTAPSPRPFAIVPWPQPKAKAAFLEAFRRLTAAAPVAAEGKTA